MTRRAEGIRRRYDRTGLLALEPKAFLELFITETQPIENAVIGEVEVVDIRGPLDQHDEGWFDSYAAIRTRVQTACERQAKAIVLRIDSPGGDACGFIECARALRDMAAAAGKPLWAYVDGEGCSAAYGLACAASRIVAAESATVGSIGIISTRLDVSEADASRGVRFAVVASGARKADGHPHVPVSAAELQATQQLVDDFAKLFHAHVAAMRGLETSAIAALEAGVLLGQPAIAARLVDEVQSFENLLAAISANTDGDTKMSNYDDARKLLVEVAASEDAEAAKAAKVVAFMDDLDKPADDDDATSSSAEDGDKPKDKDEEAKASKRAPRVDASTAGELAATVSQQGKMLAQLLADRESEKRSALLASRPDLDPAVVKVLATKSYADVKAILDALPRAAPKPAAAAATAVGTRGEGQGEAGNVARLPPDEKARLDAQMGLRPTVAGVKEEGTRLILGAPMPPPSITPQQKRTEASAT